MSKLSNSEVLYLKSQGCKKVNSSKNGRNRYEMIGETQPEMELLEAVAFIYSFFAKSRQFNSIYNQDLILRHCIVGFYVQC